MTSEKMLDAYECSFYSQHGEEGLQMCKYYPDFCKNCPEPIKVGTIKESEVKGRMDKVKGVYIEDKSPCCDIYDVIDKYRGDLISTELISLIQYELINIYGEHIPIKLIEDLVRGKKY